MAGVDYSKWDKMNLDEEEEGSSKVEPVAKPAPKKKASTAICASCRAEGAKLRCTVCKKATYCSRNCQKSDWRFHRRTCKKPEKKNKKKDAPKKPAAGSGSGSSTPTAAAAPAPAAASAPKKPKPAQASTPTQAELDEEDEAIVRSMKGYGYFHKDARQARDIIGDTTPERLESKASGDDCDDPQPVAKSKITTSSAWNTAGTWEERDMTKWAKAKLTELLVGITQEVSDGHIEVKELTDWEGDASIPVIRGKPRFLYDFTFKAKLNVNAVGSSSPKKAVVKFIDLSNDEDEHDVQLTFESPKPSQLHQAALRSVMEAPSGLLYSQFNDAFERFVREFKAK